MFGSQAKARATRLSDVDIGVYFCPEKKHPIEYEEEVFYAGEDEIWADLERILKKEADHCAGAGDEPCRRYARNRSAPCSDFEEYKPTCHDKKRPGSPWPKFFWLPSTDSNRGPDG